MNKETETVNRCNGRRFEGSWEDSLRFTPPIILGVNLTPFNV